jgi:hypothetical protein
MWVSYWYIIVTNHYILIGCTNIQTQWHNKCKGLAIYCVTWLLIEVNLIPDMNWILTSLSFEKESLIVCKICMMCCLHWICWFTINIRICTLNWGMALLCMSVHYSSIYRQCICTSHHARAHACECAHTHIRTYSIHVSTWHSSHLTQRIATE